MPQGLQPNPKQVASAQDVSQVQQFLGITSYYHHFIKKFADTAAPRHGLTRKKVELQWTPACQFAFEVLKEKLVNAPVLVYPGFDCPFILEIDTRVIGIGAVLLQLLHPVA